MCMETLFFKIAPKSLDRWLKICKIAFFLTRTLVRIKLHWILSILKNESSLHYGPHIALNPYLALACIYISLSFLKINAKFPIKTNLDSFVQVSQQITLSHLSEVPVPIAAKLLLNVTRPLFTLASIFSYFNESRQRYHFRCLY